MKPRSRRTSAARSPASEAPTTTTRPSRRRAAAPVSADTALHPLRRLVGEVDENGLDRAGGHGLFHLVTQGLVEAGGVEQRLLAVKSEDVRGEEGALRESLAPVEIDDKPQLEPRSSLGPRSQQVTQPCAFGSLGWSACLTYSISSAGGPRNAGAAGIQREREQLTDEHRPHVCGVRPAEHSL